MNTEINTSKKSATKAFKKLSGPNTYNWKSLTLEVFGWLLLVVFLMPFYIMFINSFKSRREIFESTTNLPSVWNFENYTKAMERMGMADAFTNSIIITAFSLLFLVIFSSMAAWVLCRNKAKYSKIVFFVFVGAMIVPFQAVMLPLVKWMGMMNFNLGGFNFSMLGTHYGLIFMYIGFGSSMSIFLYHGFIKGIPMEIEEAAIIDGCSKWKTYTKIILPILKPITVTVMVLNGIWIWNDFLLPFLTVNGKVNTIPLAMNTFFGAFSKQWELAMAALILAVIPIIIFYFFVQRYIIQGIVQGSVK